MVKNYKWSPLEGCLDPVNFVGRKDFVTVINRMSDDIERIK